MAFMPYFIFSPNAVMSIIGLLKGPDKTVPTPAEDWREAVVDVVIPAHNESQHIVASLASISRQTLKPRRIILIDDGSSDSTTQFAQGYCEDHCIEMMTIKRSKPIGKTPTIKRQAREFDADVEFILDGDTVLESENYIERTVQELYQAVGIASACGVILPMDRKDRVSQLGQPQVRKYLEQRPEVAHAMNPDRASWRRRSITNIYRSALYTFLQKFIYLGQMVFFGSITNPVGCAVAYRRKYVKDLFDKYEPIMGDDLTNSEDIFIGFALLNEGYRNIQLQDVYARTVEPEFNKLPRQIYMWSSAYYQCCYYFNNLLMTPFRLFRNIRKWWTERSMKEEIEEKRKIKEPYRQRFGEEYTRRYGRPMGWILLTGALEKAFFPATLLIFMILGWWWALGITMAIESVLSLFILTSIAEKGKRWKYFFRGLISIPIRYMSIVYDFFTMIRFVVDLWVLRTKKWRK